MTLKENSIVELFSSVRFAFFIISLLVVSSIIGTIIPQGQPLGFYMEKYGQANAIIMEILGFSNTYTSIWFQFLLLVLCLNLVVCSLERIPQVLKFIKKDNLSADLAKLKRNKDKIVFTSNNDAQTVETAVQAALNRKRWKTRSKRNTDFFLLFSEKCAWSRLGAYLVHISILVIILGAIIGSTFGFKAFVMVPAGGSTDTISSRNEEQTQIPLPFTLRCDAFDIEYYANGMPKEYRSDLVVLEGGKEVLKKQITVNDPLNYSGMTFYQSSYEPVSNQYNVQITKLSPSGEKNQLTGIGQKNYVAPFKKHTVQDNQVRYEIVGTGADGHGHGPYKVWFDDELGEPVQLVIEDKKPATIKRGDTSYSFMMKQRFATGLQVVKDPGVWIVYAGFGLMLFGMYVAFFMSHRRLWIAIQKTGATVTIILSGSSNKNQAGFSKTLEDIAHGLLNEKTLELRRI
ncbi:MAG: cytochrome c biogenesis protein ResB [Desulfobulbaceae bacterium]|nr:cytochrome c biogenesis protein ResB [Desulfobulbaceae bacterium]